MSRTLTRACLIFALVATSCAKSSDTVRIAFVQDLGAPDADEHAQQALQASQLAVATRAPEGVAVELVAFDLDEQPSAIDQIASDPSFVGAIVGPGADGTELAEAGVPVLSVSTIGGSPSGGAWRRFVAPMQVLADAIAERVRGRDPCVLSEEPAPDALAMMLAERLRVAVTRVDPSEPSTALRLACGTVVWAGSPDLAVRVAREGRALVGGDRLLDPDFRADAGPAGDGAVAVCACADLSTTIELEASRFIQDYQSEFGTAPGAYAVESWDATRAMLAALAVGSSRQDVAASIADLDLFDGLITRYRFAVSGELEDPARSVATYELQEGRWVFGPSA